MIERSPASISLDVDALGNMEKRIDWIKKKKQNKEVVKLEKQD